VISTSAALVSAFALPPMPPLLHDSFLLAFVLLASPWPSFSSDRATKPGSKSATRITPTHNHSQFSMSLTRAKSRPCLQVFSLVFPLGCLHALRVNLVGGSMIILAVITAVIVASSS